MLIKCLSSGDNSKQRSAQVFKTAVRASLPIHNPHQNNKADFPNNMFVCYCLSLEVGRTKVNTIMETRVAVSLVSGPTMLALVGNLR